MSGWHRARKCSTKLAVAQSCSHNMGRTKLQSTTLRMATAINWHRAHGSVTEQCQIRAAIGCLHVPMHVMAVWIGMGLALYIRKMSVSKYEWAQSQA